MMNQQLYIKTDAHTFWHKMIKSYTLPGYGYKMRDKAVTKGCTNAKLNVLLVNYEVLYKKTSSLASVKHILFRTSHQIAQSQFHKSAKKILWQINFSERVL